MRATAGGRVAALGVSGFFPAEIAYARAPREEARRRIAEWREADSAYGRADLGVRLQAPEGWVVLRKGSPFVPADASEIVALVHEPSDARAVISVDPDLHPGEKIDAALDRLVERWRRREPELVEAGRSTIELGTARRKPGGRRVEGRGQGLDRAGGRLAGREPHPLPGRLVRDRRSRLRRCPRSRA